MIKFKKLKVSELKNGDIVMFNSGFVTNEKKVVCNTFKNGMFIVTFEDQSKISDNGLTGRTYNIKLV